jgi:hypothetical protein
MVKDLIIGHDDDSEYLVKNKEKLFLTVQCSMSSDRVSICTGCGSV